MSDVVTVFTNGCFDVLHIGHVRLLEYCRTRADELTKSRQKSRIVLAPPGVSRVVVGVNSDDSVRRLKGGGRPVRPVEERVEMLLALRYVDEVIVFTGDTPLDVIERMRPDLIVKGGDYTPEDVVGRHVAPVEIFPLVDGHSTTSLISRLS